MGPLNYVFIKIIFLLIFFLSLVITLKVPNKNVHLKLSKVVAILDSGNVLHLNSAFQLLIEFVSFCLNVWTRHTAAGVAAPAELSKGWKRIELL